MSGLGELPLPMQGLVRHGKEKTRFISWRNRPTEIETAPMDSPESGDYNELEIVFFQLLHGNRTSHQARHFSTLLSST